MRIPVIKGVIDRRILANYRVDPEVLAKALPAPFRPQLHDGFGVAGICLIRLRDLRPSFVPLNFGIGSENAAHRIAVEPMIRCAIVSTATSTSAREGPMRSACSRKKSSTRRRPSAGM